MKADLSVKPNSNKIHVYPQAKVNNKALGLRAKRQDKSCSPLYDDTKAKL